MTGSSLAFHGCYLALLVGQRTQMGEDEIRHLLWALEARRLPRGHVGDLSLDDVRSPAPNANDEGIILAGTETHRIASLASVFKCAFWSVEDTCGTLSWGRYRGLLELGFATPVMTKISVRQGSGAAVRCQTRAHKATLIGYVHGVNYGLQRGYLLGDRALAHPGIPAHSAAPAWGRPGDTQTLAWRNIGTLRTRHLGLYQHILLTVARTVGILQPYEQAACTHGD